MRAFNRRVERQQLAELERLLQVQERLPACAMCRSHVCTCRRDGVMRWDLVKPRIASGAASRSSFDYVRYDASRGLERGAEGRSMSRPGNVTRLVKAAPCRAQWSGISGAGGPGARARRARCRRRGS